MEWYREIQVTCSQSTRSKRIFKMFRWILCLCNSRVVVYWRWCVFRWRRWSTRSSRGRARWRSWSRTWSLPTWSPSPSRRRRRPKPSLTVRYFSTEHWILLFFGELERLIGIHWFDQQKFCLALEPIIIKVVLRTCNLLYLNFPFTQYCPVSVFVLGRSLVTYHVTCILN